MKNKYAQSIREAFSQIIKTSKRYPNVLETYDGKEYVINFFNELLNSINVQKHSRYSDKGGVFAERFNRTMRKLFKKPVFLAAKASSINELPSVIQQ